MARKRRLGSGARDEEPLVHGRINGGRSKSIASGDSSKLGLVHAVGRCLVDGGAGTILEIGMSRTDGINLQGNITARSIARDESLIGVSALVNNLHGISRMDSGQQCTTDRFEREIFTHFSFLHSPEKANWFSGLPSGIL